MTLRKFGRYQVIEQIGQGASGVVYRGKDPLIDRIVAIKTIKYRHSKKGEQYRKFLQRFYREAQASGVLSHPNIVIIFDIGEEGEVPYIAMEFIDGVTLTQYMENHNLVKEKTLIPILESIAGALDYAHSQGVIHRDVKPSNVMYVPTERLVKVMDFSIARLDTPDFGTITTSGTMLGTPYYMPPEQIKGDKATAASDVYSLGVMAYKMITGGLPFPGKNITSIITKVLHEKPRKSAVLNGLELNPNAWERVFLKVLSKDPQERFQSASDFVRQLAKNYQLEEKKKKQKKNVKRKASDFVDQKTVLLANTDNAPSVTTRKPVFDVETKLIAEFDDSDTVPNVEEKETETVKASHSRPKQKLIVDKEPFYKAKEGGRKQSKAPKENIPRQRGTLTGKLLLLAGVMALITIILVLLSQYISL